MMDKGQILTTEFLFATVIFGALLILLLISFNDVEKTIYRDLEYSKSYEFAYNLSDQLVLSKGYPENWQELDLNQIKYFGLVDSKNKLNEDKLIRFLDYNSEYNYIKNNYGFQYDFYISFISSTSGLEVYSFGKKPNNNSTTYNIIRYVILDSQILKMNLQVWE